MGDMTIMNIDEALKAIRLERAEIERKTTMRDDEYKRATKSYIKALQKETEAFDKNAIHYDKRNNSFKQEAYDVMERFRVGAFGLLPSRDRLNKEIEKLNGFLIEQYPKLAIQVKENLEREKQSLDRRLKQVKDQNASQQYPEFNMHVPTVNLIDIKEKRIALDKELYKHDADNFYLKDYTAVPAIFNKYLTSPNVQPRLSYQQPGAGLQPRPSHNQSHLDEFLVRPHANEVVLPSKPSVRVERDSISPPRYSEKPRPKSSSRTGAGADLLSDFMYSVPKVNLSPIKHNASPTKSESLLYSPFTGERETDSRYSRPSTMKKGGARY